MVALPGQLFYQPRSLRLWPLVPLGDVSDLFDGPHQTAPLTGDGPVIYLNVGDIRNGRIELQLSGRVSEETAHSWSKRVVPEAGDVVFGYEATLGHAALLSSAHRWCLGRRVGLLRPRPERVDPRFLAYSWYSPRFQETLRANRVGGSTIESIRLTDLPTWQIALPDLDQQRAIADTLGTLDDKIELNHRMNENLEAIARTLFKSWFVDFDPVRAKSEGRDSGLPQHLAALFPDSFEDSSLGTIPTGWRASTVGEEFCLTMGQSPPGDTYNQTGVGVPFYQGRADFGGRFPARRVYCTAPTRFAHAADTLVCVRAPVGDTNLASEDCAIGRGLAAVKHKSGATSFTLLAMRSLRDSFAGFEASGTVFGSIGKEDFRQIPVIAPLAGVVLAFEELAASPGDRAAGVHTESSTLATLRDVLLPELVSGHVRSPAYLASGGDTQP